MYREFGKFGIGQFYHIFNRGVEKRDIFLKPEDYVRFIHDLYEFNDKKPAPDFNRRYKPLDKKNKTPYIVLPKSHKIIYGREADIITSHQRKLLVRLHSFVIMPNHHHLLCEQLTEDGITLFMRKLHSGYANAFNLKYKHSGHVFQGIFKSIHVKVNKYLAHLICYIHANPLDLWKKSWRTKELTQEEVREALDFLESYRWSSHLDYLGKKNFSSIISMDFLNDFFGERGGYEQFFKEWLSRYKRNEDIIPDILMWDVEHPT